MSGKAARKSCFPAACEESNASLGIATFDGVGKSSGHSLISLAACGFQLYRVSLDNDPRRKL